ncbi:hypothetical protein QQZ08_010772 [Neonectria magnoliae]|uniref:Kinesin motor domain-containing protein n=1 Tax=Neonectria magnoliae TaxID=2732573 RepID=A0ABR1HEX2_9HYPO
MDASRKSSHNLFEVFLRLRPPPHGSAIPERILNVEDPETQSHPTHITLNPPTDRRRAIEKFAFTQVFEEEASQLDVFHATKIASLVEGVLAPQGGEGTDAVVATLGVTGSGKTHTILGSKSQRGLTQLAMDVVFRSIGENMLDTHALYAVQESLQACDASESPLTVAPQFLDASGETTMASRAGSRAATPMIVRPRQPLLSYVNSPSATRQVSTLAGAIPGAFPRESIASPKSVRLVSDAPESPRPKQR